MGALRTVASGLGCALFAGIGAFVGAEVGERKGGAVGGAILGSAAGALLTGMIVGSGNERPVIDEEQLTRLLRTRFP